MGQDVYHVSFPGLGIENIEVNRVAVTVGGFSIYWYGVIIAVGFLLAFIYESWYDWTDALSVKTAFLSRATNDRPCRRT